jgi:hypothetical protein
MCASEERVTKMAAKQIKTKGEKAHNARKPPLRMQNLRNLKLLTACYFNINAARVFAGKQFLLVCCF